MRDVKILDLEENWHRRKIKEAINIHRGKLALNRDIGQELPPVMLQFVSYDVSHVTFSMLKKAVRGSRIIWKIKKKGFLRGKSFTN